MALSKVDFNNINVTPSASKKLKWNSSANGFEAGDVGGNMILLSTQTASSSSTVSFTSGIDSTYKEYIFKWINCHPANNGVQFQMNLSTDTGSNYNVTKTSSVFDAYHYENDTDNALQYLSSYDLAQSTAFQMIDFCSNDSDQSSCGTLHLFNPSSTTFVKHFFSTAQDAWLDGANGVTQNVFVGGYGNTTSAVDAVQFKFSSGNIDAGTIKMYGVS